jgi:hypothetical protein
MESAIRSAKSGEVSSARGMVAAGRLGPISDDRRRRHPSLVT